MVDAFDAAWDIIKMGRKEDDEERRMLQHIASMVMGMNYDDGGGGGYLEGLMQSGQNLDNFLRERYKETGGPSGGYMRGMDEADIIEELMGQMSDADYDRFELQSDSEEDMNRRIMEEMGRDFVPRPDNMYEAPMMVRGNMAQVMQFLSSNPQAMEVVLDMMNTDRDIYG